MNGVALPTERRAEYSAAVHLQDVIAGASYDRSVLAWRVVWVLGAISFVLACAVAIVSVRNPVIIKPVLIHDDGFTENYDKFSDIPPHIRQRSIESEILRYVFYREAFFWSLTGMKGRFHFVEALSSDLVKQAYYDWFLPGTTENPNPKSPQIYLGQDGEIDIKFLGMYRRGEDFEIIQFMRTEVKHGKVLQTRRCEVSIQYQFIAVPEDQTMPETMEPMRAVNPWGIQITQYQLQELPS
jgi:type IV secretory pathway component VirB8